LARIYKKKAFSFLEISIAFSVFLILLSCFFPSLSLFYKSYERIVKMSQIHREQQDLERLIRHSYQHRFSHLNPNFPPFFLITTDNITFIEADIDTLQTLMTEKGDTLMMQCIFQDEKNQYIKKTFILRFSQNHLYLEHYRNGYFKTGDKISILTNVQGHFTLKNSILGVHYLKKDGNKKYENFFYLTS